MAYIWINPVTDTMYETDKLNEFLRRHGYKRITVSEDWITIVKEKYRSAVEQASAAVIDMRCPKTGEVLEDAGISAEVTVPKIYPILIHCGQELSGREDLQDEEKIITTPCQALADMGNALGLKDTRFVPWNQFLKSLGGDLRCIPPKGSPIPPGFFDELRLKTVYVSGEAEMRRFFKHPIPEEVQLVEMLFCKEGCHNGDGVRMYES